MPLETTAEIRRRLEHLRSLPETPSRKREVLSLERALSQAPPTESRERTRSTPRPRRAASRSAVGPELDDEREVAEPPRKTVETEEGHRKVLVRAKRVVKDDPTESTQEKSSREAIDGIRAMLGLEHRGMS